MGIDRDDVIILDYDAGTSDESQKSEACCIFRKYRMSLREIVNEAE